MRPPKPAAGKLPVLCLVMATGTRGPGAYLVAAPARERAQQLVRRRPGVVAVTGITLIGYALNRQERVTVLEER
jgi:hypothetical protein